ncbi:MAG: hypothetical protein KGQ57_08825 [Burkholderiales bacterium]|nr:hypothetical protein [Burkholderiales bacterium]
MTADQQFPFLACPGGHGGKTTITMNYYHARGADQAPTSQYELFETVTLTKRRR